MNPNNTIGLLDIDGCALINGNSEINQEILLAFKAQGIKKIYLFSSMSYANVKVEYRTREESISRQTLIEALEKEGFEVLGVISSIDPFYQQNLGRAYQDFYQPLYAQFHLDENEFNALTNAAEENLSQLALAIDYAIIDKLYKNADKIFEKKINITKTIHHRIRSKEVEIKEIYSHPLIDDNGFLPPSVQAPANLGDLKNDFSKLWPWLAKLPYELNEEQKKFWNKGCMFAYFLYELAKHHPEIKNVIYLDDRQDCLDTTAFLNKYNNNPVNLKTILAHPQGVPQFISEQIQNHFEKIIISVPAEFLGYAVYDSFEESDTIERRMLTHFNDTVAYLRYVEEYQENGLPNDLTETLSRYLMVLFVNLMSELGCFPEIQNYECELSAEKDRVTFTCYFNDGDLFQVNFEIKSQLHFSLLGCTLDLNPLLMTPEQRIKFRHKLNNSSSYSNDKEIANELAHSRIYVLNHTKCNEILKEFPNNSISRNKGTTAALATSGAGIITAAVGAAVLTAVTGGAALPFILVAGGAGAVSLIPGAGALTKKSIDKMNKIDKQRKTVANSAVKNTRSNQSSNREFAELTDKEIKILNDCRSLILNRNTIKLLKLYKNIIDLYPGGYQIGIPQNFLNILTSFFSRLNAAAEVYHRRFNGDIQRFIDTLFSLEEINKMVLNGLASCVSVFNLRFKDESYKSLLTAFQGGLEERRTREFEQKRTEGFSRIKNFVQNGGEMVSNEILVEYIHTITDLLGNDNSETNINLGKLCDVKNKDQLDRLQTVVTAMLTQLAQLRTPANNSVVGKLSDLFGYIAGLKQQLSQSQIQLDAQQIAQKPAQPNVQPLAEAVVEGAAQPENNPSEGSQNPSLHQQLIEIAEEFGDNQLKLIQETDDPMQKTNASLQTNAAAYGFTTENVEGDGNCFYYAIVRQLNQVLNLKLNLSEEQQLSAALRKLACDYIQQNFKIFKDFIRHKQLNQQRNDKEWVEDIVITALCHALNVNLILVRSDESEPTIKRLPNAICDLYLGYQVGLHYQSLNPKNDAEQTQASLETKLEATENSELAVEPIAKTNEELFNLLKKVVELDNKMVSKVEKLKGFLANKQNQSTLIEMLNAPHSKDEEKLNNFMKPVLSCYASIHNYALQTNTDITSLAKRLFEENFTEIDISSIDIEVLVLIKQLLEKYSQINPVLSDLICINDVFYEALGGNSSVAENGRVMQGNNIAGLFGKPSSPNNVPGTKTPTLNPSPIGSPQ